MHLDLDAFYAAVEQLDHPEWRGRPVVVGAQPGGRGVVATCSYEARRFGVHSAMPIAQAARRLPPETLYLRPNMARYAQVSQQIMALLEQISPLIEQVSIDEAYLDVSGLERLIGPPERIGERARALIQTETGLTASVGIGPNRLIAKLASETSKPDGLRVVRPDQLQPFLDPMPLSALRGVGEKTAPRLQRLGWRTVGDIRRQPLERLRELLGARAGTALHLQARGIAEAAVQPLRERQSISKETTFAVDISDPQPLRETLLWAAQEVGYRARQQGLSGALITLKVRLQPFETHNRSRALSTRTASDQHIFETAWQLFTSSPWLGRPVRLIGVGLSGWEQASDPMQPDLFAHAPAYPPATPSAKLDQTLDAIREKLGDGLIRRGMTQARPTPKTQ